MAPGRVASSNVRGRPRRVGSGERMTGNPGGWVGADLERDRRALSGALRPVCLTHRTRPSSGRGVREALTGNRGARPPGNSTAYWAGKLPQLVVTVAVNASAPPAVVDAWVGLTPTESTLGGPTVIVADPRAFGSASLVATT